MGMFGVLLDACVLYPAALRDTLLRAAEVGLYRVHYSETILAEVRRSLVRTGRVTEAQAERLIAALRGAFPEAIVTGFERLIPAMSNHPKDRHVVAAAVVAGAQVIVTSNLADFPAVALEPFGIEAQSPDSFLLHLFDLDQSAMECVVRAQAAAMRIPPVTVGEVVEMLALQAPRFALRLRNLKPTEEHFRCS